jgi:hypothetical protein
MSISKSGNSSHDNAVNAAEGVRQVACAGASQSAAATAEVTFYRSAKASALANGVSPTVFIDALRALGTGGA